MNEKFATYNNLVYVNDECGEIKIRNSKDNIEEILITENNIETIEKKLSDIKDKKMSLFEIIKVPLASLAVGTLSVILIIFIKTLPYQIIFSICSLKFISMSAIILSENIKLNNKLKLSNKLQTNLLIEEYNNELKKMENLKNISKEKEVKWDSLKKIPTSEMIKRLERKQKLIRNYCNNKKEYISYYYTNSLNNLTGLYNYDDSDIEFIKLLIEEEIRKETKENGKQKIKSKKI